MNVHTAIPNKWLKAAVLGSIWAAFEIIVGSFLHNLRIPLAGTMMSMFSVFMLVAFMQHWKEPGVIIRAGVVAALMKSISPSAVIFGPMVAIFMEAFILEIITLLLGRHLLSFMLAGALGVMWALFQKVINFLIIYGFDLIRVAEALYQWIVIKTGLTEVSPRLLIALFLGGYAIAGILSATAGYYSYRKKTREELADFMMPAHQRSGHLQLPEFKNYAAYHLLIILLGVGLSLHLINAAAFYAYIPAGIIFLGYVLTRYRNALRFMKNPRIFVQFILLGLAATLLLEWLSTGQYFSREGLEIGLKMIFRAMIIIFGFAALSVELRNPLVKSILQRNGLSNLYRALNLAFTALPYLTENMPRYRNLVKKRDTFISTMISQSDMLLDNFMKEAKPRKHIYVLTGPTQSGKTTLLKELVKLMKERGIRPAGFLAPGTFKNGMRNEIFLEPLGDEKKLLLADRTPRPDWMKYRNFFFDPKVIQKGNSIISEALEKLPEQSISQEDQKLQKEQNRKHFSTSNRFRCLLILDEVGPVELKGKGWYPSLEQLKDREDLLQVWVVRDKLVREIYLNYMIPEDHVFALGKHDAEDILNILTESAKFLYL